MVYVRTFGLNMIEPCLEEIDYISTIEVEKYVLRISSFSPRGAFPWRDIDHSTTESGAAPCIHA